MISKLSSSSLKSSAPASSAAIIRSSASISDVYKRQILEEIVGNIFDEHDAEEEQIVEEADGSYVIDGMTDFDDVCELLEIQGEELEDFDTLSGFLISRINKIQVNGEHYPVSAYGYRFDVLLVEHRVIRTVRVTKEPLEEEKQILSE